jgi:hypothetical protein
MARGIKFGRKLKLTQHQIAEAIRRRDAGEALTEIGKTFNCQSLDDIKAGGRDT